MKFVAYLGCIPPNNKNVEKGDILNLYAKGVVAQGDNAWLLNNTNLVEADVAMMVGWVHENSKNTPHLIFRKQIIDHQKALGKRVLLADSNLFLYKNKENPGHYLRYSFDGVFPNTGEYCDSIVDPTRWQKLSNNLNVPLRDYRKNGNHILLCLQRNGGWSMGSYDVVDWTARTINEVRKYTDREIVIRAHPGDKGAAQYLSPQSLMAKLGSLNNVRLSNSPDLVGDLKRCWAVVNHNSSPAVGAAVEGYPVFVTDPERSQCREIAITDLSLIEHPPLNERQQWAERLAMFHWNFDEITSGECWNHMRKFV
jgi:hypothetical protein